MILMAEPSPAADETFALNRAETVAVPNHAASDEGNRTSSRDYDRDYDEAIPSEPAADRQSWGATWRKAGALLMAGLGLAGAIVLAFWLLSPNSKQSPNPNGGATSAPTATPSATAAAPSSIASTPDQDKQYV